MEISGTICAIYPIKVISPTFRTREFVLDISEEYQGVVYTGYAVMHAKNAVCDYLDDAPIGDTVRFIVGDRVSVTFGLKGYKQKEGNNFYNQLSAYKIVAADQEYPVYVPPAAPSTPSASAPPVTGQAGIAYGGYQVPKEGQQFNPFA